MLTNDGRAPDSLLRRLGLGRLAYRFYYRPKTYIAGVRARGLCNHISNEKGRLAMKRAAKHLDAAPAATLPPPSLRAKIVFLTGHAYWWQTAWCGTSLFRQVETGLPLEIIDDGTLSISQAAVLQRVFPKAEMARAAPVETVLRQRLPPEKFPLIWHYRRVKPIFRKLTDIFGRDDHWRLLLDSDMLFFRKPDLLLDWIGSPDKPVYMIDIKNAYGYSPELMARLAGGAIPGRVNIGVFGLSGHLIDWERLEDWLARLTEAEGLRYNLTQALSAMHLVNRECLALPPEDYVVLPDENRILNPKEILQHYVAESKDGYYRHAWRRFLTGENQ